MRYAAISVQVPDCTRSKAGAATCRLVAVMALIICSASALARAQTITDPVGPPASYITLRSDDLMAGVVQPAIYQLNTYQVGTQNQLSTQITAATATIGVANASTISAAGRILSQDNDQVVNVGRSADGKSLEVRLPLSGGVVNLPSLHNAIANVPDLVSVAVGDMDKVPDALGANHDEVVVAYAQNGSNGNYKVNLAVLNYTDTQGGLLAPVVTTIQLPFEVPYSSYQTYNKGNVVGLFSVAIGDFDGDGQNEIALATLGSYGSGQVNLTFFRYVHDTDTPSLAQKSNSTFYAGNRLVGYLPTISLMAGDFTGTRKKAELVLALQYDMKDPTAFGRYLTINVLRVIDANADLQPALKGVLATTAYTAPKFPTSSVRLIGLPVLFLYDPPAGFDLYRREVALVYNEPQSSTSTSAQLDVVAFAISSDLNSIRPLFNGQELELQNTAVGEKFAATAGGLAVNANINAPLWSLAIAQVTNTTTQISSGSSQETLTTIGISGTRMAVASTNSLAYSCCGNSVPFGSDQAFQPTVQAYDYRGRTVLLGAPIRLTVNNVINTDFVLQEPPKHILWCEAQQVGCESTASQVVNVSRVPGIAASLTTKAGTSFEAKSEDKSAASIGGSLALSASESLSVTAGIPLAGLKTTNTLSVEGNLKASYNYDQNESSYNSKDSSRSVNETASTDYDDYISGRVQTMEIWRYRVLGITSQDEEGNGVNIYYDLVLPGSTIELRGGGLNQDWYEPLHENGNILSYPAPSGNTFNPPDIGTYGIPCYSGATDCVDGMVQQSGPMIPASQGSIDGNAGTISLEYSNSNDSSGTISYEHKISASSDIKVSYSAQIKTPTIKAKTSASAAVSFDTKNSWGNTATSTSTTTHKTGITISRSPINFAQAYNFFPTIYTTLDGTIKVAHAVDPLGSRSGRDFWTTVYGSEPDPALNLPLRFVRGNIGSSNTITWTPNTLISRKRMRGFFLMTPDLDPVTGEYVILSQAPADGDQVRVSAQVYNYSTGQSFDNCLVQFYAIKYDSFSNVESGARTLIGSTTISLPPRGTAPAQIIWNTKGFGPATGGQDYRIYVDLNYPSSANPNPIVELYPPEDPTKQYASGLPVGLDPGQNNEGWGLATVVAAAAAQASISSQPVALSFGKTPLAIARSGRLFSENLAARVGAPTELRAEVCASSSNLRDPVDVIVFDGDPAQGNVIAWKRLYVPNQNACEGTWFSWTPTSGRHHLVAAILPNSVTPILPDNALLTSKPTSLTEARLSVNVP